MLGAWVDAKQVKEELEAVQRQKAALHAEVQKAKSSQQYARDRVDIMRDSLKATKDAAEDKQKELEDSCSRRRSQKRAGSPRRRRSCRRKRKVQAGRD
eukprot:917471-Pleurochrysis_carterae.AAC.1